MTSCGVVRGRINCSVAREPTSWWVMWEMMPCSGMPVMTLSLETRRYSRGRRGMMCSTAVMVTTSFRLVAGRMICTAGQEMIV